MDVRQYIIGTCYCLGSVMLYVGSTMLLNGMYLDVANSPYLFTYVMESVKVVYFILFILPIQGNDYDRVKYPLKNVLATAAAYSAMISIATYIFDLGINFTTPSSGLCVNTSYTVFTCILSVWILKEKYNIYKLIACVIAVAGIVIICLGDNSVTLSMVSGDLLCVLSAILLAFNSIFMKVRIPSDDGFPYFLMFGIAGVTIMAIFWPGIIILNAIGFEKFIFPSLKEVGLCLLLAVTNCLLPDFFYLKALIMLGPTVCTFLYMMIIPLSMVGDYWYQHTKHNIYFVLGNVAIVVAIVILLVGTNREENKKKQETLDNDESIEICQKNIL